MAVRPHPKAVAKIVDQAEQLLAFYDFPAKHWVYLKHQPDRVDLRHGAVADQGAGQLSRRLWRWCSRSSNLPKTAGAVNGTAPGRARASRSVNGTPKLTPGGI